ncbi:hypothetical protein H8S37_03940 [Mediterraneibacter sp. NSJ-55]|uniref:Uncharacterized protein n=1 Tax=Mediterraneibacter hominis TaxID=2763054 RepID=A0A923LGY0_9FIRM|nr:hypothetical protein [Mediterraneibacter hominis]MBC5688084.1 hypothetical protein [Mediterraneibacter hominis]
MSCIMMIIAALIVTVILFVVTGWRVELSDIPYAIITFGFVVAMLYSFRCMIPV